MIGKYPGSPVYLRAADGTLYNTGMITSMRADEGGLTVVFAGPQWPQAEFEAEAGPADRLFAALKDTASEGGGVLEWSSVDKVWRHMSRGYVLATF